MTEVEEEGIMGISELMLYIDWAVILGAEILN